MKTDKVHFTPEQGRKDYATVAGILLKTSFMVLLVMVTFSASYYVFSMTERTPQLIINSGFVMVLGYLAVLNFRHKGGDYSILILYRYWALSICGIYNGRQWSFFLYLLYAIMMVLDIIGVGLPDLFYSDGGRLLQRIAMMVLGGALFLFDLNETRRTISDRDNKNKEWKRAAEIVFAIGWIYVDVFFMIVMILD